MVAAVEKLNLVGTFIKVVLQWHKIIKREVSTKQSRGSL